MLKTTKRRAVNYNYSQPAVLVDSRCLVLCNVRLKSRFVSETLIGSVLFLSRS